MRWKEYKGPDSGTKRIRKGFLFYPRCVDGESRWWEQACWLEVYHELRPYDLGSPWRPWYWVNIDDAGVGGYPWPTRQAVQRMVGNTLVINEEDYRAMEGEPDGH